uniref:Cytochrome c oxidase subunit 2 n=1 Tax=Hylaeus dilatatus TaxID=1542591 RepID=A0A0S2LTF7_9HYME|nr:cytochrome c oxidase subunit II [Hylaeus dilatatus]AJG02940.1 cytochrome c oxidase subunit II [Hylaeus dilatatus]ALO64646.1 cytochrome c oxidase subunit II [Hylaeus dilatatus]
MSHWNMYSFQDPNSPFSDNLNLFHNFTMIFMIMIITLTLLIMIDFSMNKFMNRFLLKNHNIEIIWTIIPIMILMIIAFPSLKTLYFIDEIWNPTFFTIKSIGHQWYWSYEYSELNKIEFDSYMIKNNENMNLFRLLETDNRLIIPMKTPIRMLSTSMDVIHSWTIPSLGMKMDSIPGRINQMNLFSNRPGLYFGQCSEICGTNHSFMPIMMESTNFKNFMNWLKSI